MESFLDIEDYVGTIVGDIGWKSIATGAGHTFDMRVGSQYHESVPVYKLEIEIDKRIKLLDLHTILTNT